jgi:hypothetical protein
MGRPESYADSCSRLAVSIQLNPVLTSSRSRYFLLFLFLFLFHLHLLFLIPQYIHVTLIPCQLYYTSLTDTYVCI